VTSRGASSRSAPSRRTRISSTVPAARPAPTTTAARWPSRDSVNRRTRVPGTSTGPVPGPGPGEAICSARRSTATVRTPRPSQTSTAPVASTAQTSPARSNCGRVRSLPDSTRRAAPAVPGAGATTTARPSARTTASRPVGGSTAIDRGSPPVNSSGVTPRTSLSEPGSPRTSNGRPRWTASTVRSPPAAVRTSGLYWSQESTGWSAGTWRGRSDAPPETIETADTAGCSWRSVVTTCADSSTRAVSSRSRAGAVRSTVATPSATGTAATASWVPPGRAERTAGASQSDGPATSRWTSCAASVPRSGR